MVFFIKIQLSCCWGGWVGNRMVMKVRGPLASAKANNQTNKSINENLSSKASMGKNSFFKTIGSALNEKFKKVVDNLTV